MTDEPIDLDEHRGMAAQRATDIRRRSGKVAADQAELRRRQEELEQSLLDAPSATWPEAAEKARYLITLFAETLGAQDQRRHKLIASVLDDLDKLSRTVAARPTPDRQRLIPSRSIRFRNAFRRRRRPCACRVG